MASGTAHNDGMANEVEGGTQQEVTTGAQDAQESLEPRQHPRLIRRLFEVLDGRHSVHNGIKMDLTLAAFDTKLHELRALETTEKKGFVLEMLAIADPAEEESAEDVSYLAGIVVLEAIGCKEGNKEARRDYVIGEMVEIVEQTCAEMGHVREKIELMLNDERAMGGHRATEVDAMEVNVRREMETRRLSRAIYIPKSSRQLTVEDLEGDKLVLPSFKWQGTPTARRPTTRATNPHFHTTADVPDSTESSPEAEDRSDPSSKLNATEIEATELPERHGNASSSGRRKLITNPTKNSSGAMMPPTTMTTTTNATSFPGPQTPTRARPSNPSSGGGRGNRTNHSTDRYTIEEKISVLQIFPKRDNVATAALEAAHLRNTGVSRTYTGLRQKFYDLGAQNITVQMLQAEQAARDADDDA